MEYRGLLGLFLGTLHHKLVVTGDQKVRVEVLGQPLVEVGHSRLEAVRPHIENVRKSPSRPSPSSHSPYLRRFRVTINDRHHGDRHPIVTVTVTKNRLG